MADWPETYETRVVPKTMEVGTRMMHARPVPDLQCIQGWHR